MEGSDGEGPPGMALPPSPPSESAPTVSFLGSL